MSPSTRPRRTPPRQWSSRRAASASHAPAGRWVASCRFASLLVASVPLFLAFGVQHAVTFQRRDLVARVAVLRHDVGAVLGEFRWRPTRAAWRARQLDRRTDAAIPVE